MDGDYCGECEKKDNRIVELEFENEDLEKGLYFSTTVIFMGVLIIFFGTPGSLSWENLGLTILAIAVGLLAYRQWAMKPFTTRL